MSVSTEFGTVEVDISLFLYDVLKIFSVEDFGVSVVVMLSVPMMPVMTKPSFVVVAGTSDGELVTSRSGVSDRSVVSAVTTTEVIVVEAMFDDSSSVVNSGDVVDVPKTLPSTFDPSVVEIVDAILVEDSVVECS